MCHRLRLSLFLMIIAVTLLSVACLAQQSVTVETPLFSLTIPESVSDICCITVDENTVFFYQEQSNSDFSGFVASIGAYTSLSEYAHISNFDRGGELKHETDGKYDIVIAYPTGVTFDFRDSDLTNDYRAIHNAIPGIARSIHPADGYTYIEQENVDDSELYADTLHRLQELVDDHASPEELQAEGFSTLYQYHYNMQGNPQDLIGYAFLDINHDGYDELLIGSMVEMNKIIYDLYTCVNGEATHILSSVEKDNYYLEGEGMRIKEIANEKAGEAFMEYFFLDSNTSVLDSQVRIVLSRSMDIYHPYFISYNGEEDLSPISKKVWDGYQSRQNDVIHPDFQSLGSF